MKILRVDTNDEVYVYDKDNPLKVVKTKKIKPTYNLYVEMTQKEYQLVAYMLVKYQNEVESIVPNKRIIEELIKETK